jgi:hypothetical protein
VSEPTAPAPTGKGRPTPKRSASERRRGPVAPPPKTRKEAAKRAREEAIAARSSIRAGAARGDARYLSKRDAGPVRRLVRDTVDGKRNIGVVILPLAVLLLLANISGDATFQAITTALWLASVLALLVDTVLTGLLIRRRVRQAFPEEGRLASHIGYGLLRSTVFRRFRLPPPAVTPGPLPWARRKG